MPASDTTICNLALGKLGSKRIQSLDDASPEARACKLFYAPTRDQVLRDHRWNFASKRATLSQLSTPPAFGWAFAYQLPVDHIRLLQLNGWGEGEREGNWEIEGDKLLTDADIAQIKYTARITDGNLFDASFVKALACKLASEICVQLAGSNSTAESLIQEYERVTAPSARLADARESRTKIKMPWVTSNLVRARFGG